jgi:competence protein ComEA
VGRSLAMRIVEYRNKNGPFASVEDIKKVSGIKDSLFNKIKDKITIE